MMDALTIATSLVKQFEGCSLKPYTCPAGFWTIGYGNTVTADGRPVTDFTPPLTQEGADALLQQTLQNVQKQVAKLVKVPLAPQQEGALLSLTYNIGIGNLDGSTLLRYLNSGKYMQAADQFLRWNKAGGRVLNGLTRRRQAERKLFMEGIS
ncbi:lysozyme [Acetobacteraceae bacterium ESL0709]|nr:lysozyme [Acetobacteraceae bacterium ESL0697]MDF7678084.1 lysozyme [Acetobacteraceae bacterium ESL0709]